ncbi:hypothetical protein GW796_08275 [archaeon]|nr:hypothetical protein [archaeon]
MRFKIKKVFFAAIISLVVLTACGKREMTVEEFKSKSAEIEKMNSYQESEIVGKVKGSDVLIHKFIDKETNNVCYFIEYNFQNMSCLNIK